MILLNSSNPWLSIRNKIAIFIMSFSGDEGCLFQCVRALEKLSPRYDFEIFVIDDGHNPLENIPENVHYSKSFFNRNGNLNGRECVEGMLFCMLEAARLSGADVVIKIDSDIILNNLNWVKDFNPLQSHIGFQIQNQSHVSGCCYSLPTSALVKMLKVLRSEPKNRDIPESILMTSLSEKVGLKKVLHVCDSSNPDLWRASSIDCKEIENGLSPHAYGLMENLDVILCEVIGANGDKDINFKLMKEYLNRKNAQGE